MTIPAADAILSPRFLFVLFILNLHIYIFIQYCFLSFVTFCILTCWIFFLPSLLFLFTFFSASDAHMLLPWHGTMWTSLLSFLYPLCNQQCRSAKCSCFDVIFLLLDFVNLAAENCAWYLTTTPGILCCPGFHFFSAFFEICIFSSLIATVSHWLANNSSSCLQFPVFGFQFLTQLIFLPQRWRQLVLIKLYHVVTKLHCITFQNVIICMQRILFTLSNCNNLAHCFHNVEEKISSNAVIFRGSFWSYTKQIIKHVFTSVVNTIEGIFLIILIRHTNSIPFTHVVNCDQSVSKVTLHEDQCMFSPESRIPFEGFSWKFLCGTLTLFPSHILFLQSVSN